jgi:hypothetical protein
MLLVKDGMEYSEGEPSQGGNCESIDLSKMEEFNEFK